MPWKGALSWHRTDEAGPRTRRHPRVTLDDRRLPLTAIEYDLLRVLSLRAGAVVPTAVLRSSVFRLASGVLTIIKVRRH